MMDHLRKPGSPGLRLVLLGAGMIVSMSCGDDPVSQPSEGTILVAANTVGVDIDPNGYSVSLNNAPTGVLEQAIDTLFVSDLEAGSYQVRLAGMAANCTTAPADNPITVEVVPADTVNAEFEVTCDELGPPGGGDPERATRMLSRGGR